MSADAAQSQEFIVSWEEFHRNARALAWRLQEFGPFTGVVIITRGGQVPSAIVARELDIRLLDTVCIVSYDDVRQQGKPAVLKKPLMPEGDGAGWLVIDDLVDTGLTVRLVREMLPKAHFASVYAKPAGRGSIDTYITEVSQDTWIVFPWDNPGP